MTKPSPNGTWKTAFQLKPALFQRDIYPYEVELRVLEKGNPEAIDTVLQRAFQILQGMGFAIQANIESEHYLKAAIKAGWITSPACEIETVENSAGKKQRYLLDGVEVGDLHPGKVRWYGQRVLEAYHEATKDPDPN